MSDRALFDLGLAMVLLGFAAAMAAAVLMAFPGVRGSARGGGALIIGPIPIIFGSDRESLRAVLVIAVILFLIVLGVTLVPVLRG